MSTDDDTTAAPDPDDDVETAGLARADSLPETTEDYRRRRARKVADLPRHLFVELYLRLEKAEADAQGDRRTAAQDRERAHELLSGAVAALEQEHDEAKRRSDEIDQQVRGLTVQVEGSRRELNEALHDRDMALVACREAEMQREQAVGEAESAARTRAGEIVRDAEATAADVRRAAEADAQCVREAAAAERTAAAEQQRASLEGQLERLRADQAELEASQERVRLQDEDVKRGQARHAARAKALDDEIRDRAKRAIGSVERERDELRRHAASLQGQLQEHKGRLAAVERRDGRSFDEILRDLADAERDRDALDDRLRRAPGEDVVEERDRLRSRDAEQRDELRRLRDQLGQQEDLEDRVQQLTDEVRRRTREVAARKEDAKELEADRDLLRRDLRLLHDAGSAGDPDADLVRIDTDEEDIEVKRGAVAKYEPSLADLVDDARAWMLKEHGLSYAADDVRTFVAGLAGGQLLILDGISGTGKTSLPIAFADVVGAECAIVEVQSAWRDRYDLVGTYNPFERRLYPTEFAKAVYRACGVWAGKPVFVVLDEMNLSQPEHYLADVLSTLANKKLRVQLLPAPVGKAKHLLGEQDLPIPPNLWFVGTANIDESTQTIADKTYDRATLIELPSRKSTEKIPPRGPRSGRLEVSHLHERFELAVGGGLHPDVRRLIDDENLREHCGELRVDFGNRIGMIAERFVPVFCAAGGKPRDALDRLVTTKVVRKLGALYRVSDSDLRQFVLLLRDATQRLDDLPLTKRALRFQGKRLDQLEVITDIIGP